MHVEIVLTEYALLSDHVSWNFGFERARRVQTDKTEMFFRSASTIRYECIKALLFGLLV
jgi:hypothetical protein